MDDITLPGKKQNIEVQNKEVDLGEPTSFLDHVYLGFSRRQCEISKDIVDKHRTMFESRISAGDAKKLHHSENFRISSWSYDTEGHAKKCVERYCELANRTTQQLNHFKEESISLDAGLRLDGIPALDLWDLIVSVLGNTTQDHYRTGRPVVCSNERHKRQQSRRVTNDLDNVDFIPSNINSSHQGALLYVFEDNEAFIKMIQREEALQ